MGKITVRRKGFVARARKKQWVVHRKGKRIIARRRKKTWRVSGTVYKKEDIGVPGKGKKLIKVRKGLMTKYAIEGGFIKPGQRIKDIPDSKIDDFALYLAERVGPAKAQKMFRAQMIFRKRTDGAFYYKMKKAHDTITKKYESELAPKEAIRKWKKMPSAVRKRKMPERKGRPGYKKVKRYIIRNGKRILTTMWVKVK